jgi:tetratricopeptide (TPR) repeat protein
VKKPEVCIELWNEVIESDPSNAEALNEPRRLHERAEGVGAARVGAARSRPRSPSTSRPSRRCSAKLGQLYGERLNNDEAAVEAWQQLLALNPQDRKAQEALKKKYLTLGRWDDLEVFYAESGKWDEFIRVLETQEAKETDDGPKIGLLVKTAQLWITQKGKLDRAAKAYEKVLSLDPNHLGAAEALIPIYESRRTTRRASRAPSRSSSPTIRGRSRSSSCCARSRVSTRRS